MKLTRAVRPLTGVLAAALLVLAAGQTASANIVFTPGNNPVPGDVNIMFAAKETGSTITGDANGVPVQFSSTTDILDQNASGQASIQTTDPKNNPINDITVIVPGGSYTGLIFNPENGSGTATVTVTGTSGAVYTYTLGNGQNWLTITTTGGDKIASTTISVPDPDGFKTFKQPRIVGAVVVPEPSTILGAGMAGLVGIVCVARRNRVKLA